MDYKKIARDARIKVLELVYKAQTSHIGSNMSAIDIFTVLFDKANILKDEVVLSAGWKSASWFYFLWRKGVITKEELDSFCMPGSPFIGLVEPMGRWGLRFGGGSMGHGLAFSASLAWDKLDRGEGGHVWCVMSDGEQAIGMNTEAARVAAHHKLGNLIAIIDYNKLCGMGETNKILNIEPLEKYWESLGWEWVKISGHDFTGNSSLKAIQNIEWLIKKNPTKPHVIIANTTKGKGVSFMENINDWHYRKIDEESYGKAAHELAQ